ncbi:hypothetical protein PFISCL1PPCAC_28474, partial [Pristionchus fissidentatus]
HVVCLADRSILNKKHCGRVYTDSFSNAKISCGVDPDCCNKINIEFLNDIKNHCSMKLVSGHSSQ